MKFNSSCRLENESRRVCIVKLEGQIHGARGVYNESVIITNVKPERKYAC